MPDVPLAYFITWSTYGSWLPGDERGWVETGRPGIQAPDEERFLHTDRNLFFDPVVLTQSQREVVAAAIVDHCAFRSWTLHAKNPRTNHVHVVVTSDLPPEVTRDQLKSWVSRRLNESFGKRQVWWTRYGSTRWIWDETSLEDAINYAIDGQ
ncbi:MAG: hypothetical protein SH850_11145 [Planctomycetaceae bacterium]|nr:hypothetical protein [Planctomycetaceae bacterium]